MILTSQGQSRFSTAACGEASITPHCRSRTAPRMLQPTMPDTSAAELEAFLAAHPQVRFFDAFLNDLSTVERGKRIDRAGIARIYDAGMLLPGSMFALDVQGGTAEATGLGFDDGDADRPCRPIPGTLLPVPWLADEGVAQAAVVHARAGRTRLLRRPAARAGASARPLPSPQPDPGRGDRVRVLFRRPAARPGRAAAAAAPAR